MCDSGVRSFALTIIVRATARLGLGRYLPSTGPSARANGARESASLRTAGDHLEPARRADIRDQCLSAEVAFFFKQWGGVQKKRTDRVLEGRTWDEMPAPKSNVANRRLPLLRVAG
jgi:Protein of unknown function (DUF5131)